jgi:hypothetical protein
LSRIVFGVLLLAVAGMSLLIASSVTSTECNSRLLGGAGKVEDPLRFEVTGQVGLTGLIDSCLPYRGLPSVQIIYRNLSFAVPGVNEYFIGRPWLGLTFLVSTVIGVFLAAVWLALALAGRKIKIVKRHE